MMPRRVNSALGRACRAALDRFAPLRCLYCDEPSGTAAAICAVCRGELVFNTDGCRRCALPGCGGSLCPACQQRPPPLAGITAACVYDEALAYLLRRWKYQRDATLASTAAALMLAAPAQPPVCDLQLATPLHWRRRLRRGFNQSDDLLRALARARPGLRAAAPVRLLRPRATVAQAASARDARLRNLAGAFRVSGDPGGRSVLLIDDVCTTGATGNAMAAALLAAGAREVYLWCLARTPTH